MMLLGFIVISWLALITDQGRLSYYIHDYQPLVYDALRLHVQHERVRRSLDRTIMLRFRAYGRNFDLKLKKDNSVFSHDHMLKESDGTLRSIDTSYIYTGHLEGNPSSFAHIAVINGTVRGFITVPGETTFHIEPAIAYFSKADFHTVIYPESHMDLSSFRLHRSMGHGLCGNDDAAAWMKRQAEFPVEQIFQSRLKHGTASSVSRGTTERESLTDSRRKRRSVIGTRNTCYLYLRADPIFWEYVKYRKYRMELSNTRTQEEILAFFASHVHAVKNIYSRTRFQTYDGRSRYVGVDFVVQRSSIMTMENQFCGTNKASDFCNRNMDVTNFLNLNSLDQHDEFCLAYFFTFRDFSKGTLGLAWVGSDSRAAGGVCERHKDYPEGGARVGKSLNTGVLTTVNYGKPVPTRVSQLTFAHEVGHSFGSPHDSGPTCAPYGSSGGEAEQGNYIMFASATMGDKSHNDDFSMCSLDNVTRVLDAVLTERHGKVNCFQKSTEAFCGNGIVEQGEECDCGYEAECDDQCCYGKESTDGAECTLRPGKKCSPTSGPCCSRDCEYVSAGQAVICRPQDGCQHESCCSGFSSQCPTARQKPNGTFCNDFSQICQSGECVGSVCHQIDWEECFLTDDQDHHVSGHGGVSGGDVASRPSPEAMCYVSCRNRQTGLCVSSYSLSDIGQSENVKMRDLLLEIVSTDREILSSVFLQGIQLPAGSPCNDLRGYCDVFHKCRGVDADGPLSRLKNFVFNPEMLQGVKEWVTAHWWAALLIVTAVVVVMGIFIKVCAVHTPSSNPSKPKARRISDTLRRRPRSAQRCGGLAGGGQSHDSHAVALTEASQSTDEPSDFGRSLSDSRSCNRCINHPRAFKVSGSQSSAIPSAADVQKLLEPAPCYHAASVHGGQRLPPHGKGKRG